MACGGDEGPLEPNREAPIRVGLGLIATTETFDFGEVRVGTRTPFQTLRLRNSSGVLLENVRLRRLAGFREDAFWAEIHPALISPFGSGTSGWAFPQWKRDSSGPRSRSLRTGREGRYRSGSNYSGLGCLLQTDALRSNPRAPGWTSAASSLPRKSLNILAFPPEENGHPLRAYSSKSDILTACSSSPEQYKALAPLLKDIL